MPSKEVSYNNKTLLGVDFGGFRTGLAVGINGIVSPMNVIESRDVMYTASQIAKAASENKVSAIVLGLPLDYEGRETPQSLETRRFGKILKNIAKVPVLFCNEIETTLEAEAEEDVEMPKTLKQRRDSVSAGIILKRFFSDQEI